MDTDRRKTGLDDPRALQILTTEHHAYLQIVPELEPFFLTGHEAEAGPLPWTWLEPAWRQAGQQLDDNLERRGSSELDPGWLARE